MRLDAWKNSLQPLPGLLTFCHLPGWFPGPRARRPPRPRPCHCGSGGFPRTWWTACWCGTGRQSQGHTWMLLWPQDPMGSSWHRVGSGVGNGSGPVQGASRHWSLKEISGPHRAELLFPPGWGWEGCLEVSWSHSQLQQSHLELLSRTTSIGFGITPGMDTPQPLWANCARAQSPSCCEDASLMCTGTLPCSMASAPATGHPLSCLPPGVYGY